MELCSISSQEHLSGCQFPDSTGGLWAALPSQPLAGPHHDLTCEGARAGPLPEKRMADLGAQAPPGADYASSWGLRPGLGPLHTPPHPSVPGLTLPCLPGVEGREAGLEGGGQQAVWVCWHPSLGQGDTDPRHPREKPSASTSQSGCGQEKGESPRLRPLTWAGRPNPASYRSGGSILSRPSPTPRWPPMKPPLVQRWPD